jgi:hypothetical protein
MTKTLTLAKEDTVLAAGAKAPAVEKAFVVAVHGRMLNLHTDVWLTADPKNVELDEYVRGQLAAGKLAIVTP